MAACRTGESVTVWRATRGGTKKKIEVNMNEVQDGGGKDVTLQAGDVITVPASPVKIVPYSAYWVLTTVVRVGASFPIPSMRGSPLSWSGAKPPQRI